MSKVELKNLEEYLFHSLCAVGMNEEHAGWTSEIYMRATLRGVGHHDIYDFPGRLRGLINKKLNSTPSIKLMRSYEAMESFDGDNGLGEVCSTYIMKRGMELADKFGISFCTINNSNHFLAAAPYVEKAAEEGFVAIIYTRGGPSMSVTMDRKGSAVGACPMGFAAPTNEGYPFMMDICLAYASNGLINAKINAGESVPPYWGLDAQGDPTTDPRAIKEGGTRLPIGGHKGFGLSLMGEIFTGVLSGGQVIDEPHPVTGEVGAASQAVIVIKPDGLMEPDKFRLRTSNMIQRVEARAPGVHIPGQGSFRNKEKYRAENSIDLKTELIEKLNRVAVELGIKQISILV